MIGYEMSGASKFDRDMRQAGSEGASLGEAGMQAFLLNKQNEMMMGNGSASMYARTSRIFAAKGLDGLLKAGNALDKGVFTVAGRALQKHGSRAGSVFPKVTGNPAAINAQGKSVLNGILTNPNRTSVTRHHARFGNIMDVQIPRGQGARFSADG